MKPVGVLSKFEAGNCDQPDIDHQHDGATAHQPSVSTAVAEGETIKAAIEAVEKGDATG